MALKKNDPQEITVHAKSGGRLVAMKLRVELRRALPQ
jgi:hypothetical protein